MDLKTLYREIILDHYKKPRNTTPIEAPDREARCKNPSCGDRVTLSLKLDGEVISAVALAGTGCAISQASASMMTQAIKGKTLAQAEALRQAVRAMIVDGQPADQQALGELAVLEGVAKLHARVKCAMCGFSALEAALEQRTDEVDMELDETLPSSQRAGNI
jgi:nitrogen fixation protein NifU and related proteins